VGLCHHPLAAKVEITNTTAGTMLHIATGEIGFNYYFLFNVFGGHIFQKKNKYEFFSR